MNAAKLHHSWWSGSHDCSCSPSLSLSQPTASHSGYYCFPLSFIPSVSKYFTGTVSPKAFVTVFSLFSFLFLPSFIYFTFFNSCFLLIVFCPVSLLLCFPSDLFFTFSLLFLFFVYYPSFPFFLSPSALFFLAVFFTSIWFSIFLCFAPATFPYFPSHSSLFTLTFLLNSLYSPPPPSHFCLLLTHFLCCFPSLCAFFRFPFYCAHFS